MYTKYKYGNSNNYCIILIYINHTHRFTQVGINHKIAVKMQTYIIGEHKTKQAIGITISHKNQFHQIIYHIC